MKKYLLYILSMVCCVCLFACKSKENENKEFDYDTIPDTMESSSYDIAFVSDIGELKDKAFNQGTWEGVKRYAHENKKSYKYYQPENGNNASDEDRYKAMKSAIEKGAKVIVSSGMAQEKAITQAATEHPDVKFIFIDGKTVNLENVSAIVFQEEQAAFLAGYASVMDGYTKFGFFGEDSENASQKRSAYGFIQGVNEAAKEKNMVIDIKLSWKAESPEGQADESKKMIEDWYQSGTEVIFTCGNVSSDVMAVAKEKNKKVISVDIDHSHNNQNVLTSAVKGLREGAMYALSNLFNDKWSDFSNKSVSLGIKDDAVGLPYSNASWRFNKFSVKDYNKLISNLKQESIKIDSNFEGFETKKYSNVKLEII